jgi:hypothetical protein
MAVNPARLDALADQLDVISEEIGDLSIDIIREALRSGDKRPDADKRLASARRSVDKAAHTLRQLAAGADGLDDDD